MTPKTKYPMFEAMRRAYAQAQEDETLLPLVLANSQGKPLGRIAKSDSVIFYNIRGEREIELTRSLTEDNFHEFPAEKSLRLNFATMIEYQKGLNVRVAFPPEEIIQDTLSDIISRNHLKQVKITEAEKATHIGSGRRIYSDQLKIDQAIKDKSFYQNPSFLSVMRKARKTGSALHLIGIVSFFSSHGSINHLFALVDMAKNEGVRDLFIHAMLGRRGEMPESGAQYIKKIEEKVSEIKLGKVVSVIGRYWSMDREENWDRIRKTYRMLIYGEGEKIIEVNDNGS